MMKEKTNKHSEVVDDKLLESMRLKTPVSLTTGVRKPPTNDYIPRIQPPWLKYDRKVLRFTGYFQESVSEDPHENFRLRKLLIYYYLDDDTIHIAEPRIENSGLLQGLFLKRQKVKKQLENPEEFIHWRDINLAMNLNVNEHVIRITNCDEFTHNFYNEMDCPLNEVEDIPQDNFEILKILKEVKIPPPDTKEYKEYFEVKLGGGHPNNGLHQYLANDRQVLSFKVLWDDRSLEGDVNYFEMNYFLADDTVEVKEMNKNNSGKEPFPLLLRRGKLPKIPIMTFYPGMTLEKQEFYSPSDLLCGNSVQIYGRGCLIYNCDDFTKDYYLRNFGIEQKPINLKMEKAKRYYQQIPPYNGFGTEEDSLGSVYNLQPKPPKKDLNKMFKSDQNILRFEARLISKNREDNNQKFIVSFFCGDDTVQVLHSTSTNSGIVGGKLIQRGQHKNPITGKIYQDKDFQIGEIITLLVYNFQIIRCDEFTWNYMQENLRKYPKSNWELVVEKIRKFSTKFQSFDDFLINLLKNIDPEGSGKTSFPNLANGFKNLNMNLNYQEIYTLMRKFEAGDWFINVKE